MILTHFCLQADSVVAQGRQARNYLAPRRYERCNPGHRDYGGPEGDTLAPSHDGASELARQTYRADDALDLVEYAILGALIALVCVAMIINLGNSMNGALNNADTQLRADGGA